MEDNENIYLQFNAMEALIVRNINGNDASTSRARFHSLRDASALETKRCLTCVETASRWLVAALRVLFII